MEWSSQDGWTFTIQRRSMSLAGYLEGLLSAQDFKGLNEILEFQP
jgi:hypothetical protein